MDSYSMNTSNQYIKYHISAYQNSQDIVNNCSNVTIHVYAWRTNTGYTTYGNGTVYCRINGELYSQPISNNQLITSNGITLFSINLNIPHNSDGSKILTTSAWIVHDRFSSSEQSFNFTLNTIPRQSELDSFSCDTNYLDGNLTVRFSPKTSIYYYKLRLSVPYVGVIKYEYLGKHSSTYTVDTTFSSEELEELYNKYTNVATIPIGAVIETYSDEAYTVKIGESSEAIITLAMPESVKPSVILTISEVVEKVQGKVKVYCKELSKLRIVASNTPVYGATITSCVINANNETYDGSDITTDYLSISGDMTISVTVKDSRGRVATEEVTIDIADYHKPLINAYTVVRCDANGKESEDGSNIKVHYNIDVTDINGNTPTYKIGYKRKSDTVFKFVEVKTAEGDKIINNIDPNYTYDITLTAQDQFNSTVLATVVSTAFTLMDFHSGGKGIAIGKVAEGDGLDVNLKASFRKGIYLKVNEEDVSLLELIYPVGSIFMSANDVNPGALFGGTWERWGTGRVPVGVDPDDEDFNNSELTGGSKTMMLKAPIGATNNNIAAIGYQIENRIKGVDYDYELRVSDVSRGISSSNVNHSLRIYETTDEDNPTPHISKMQPYITCYMFKRTK